MKRQQFEDEPCVEAPIGVGIKDRLCSAVARAEDLMAKLESHLLPIRESRPLGDACCGEGCPSTASYFAEIHEATTRINAISARIEELMDEIKI